MDSFKNEILIFKNTTIDFDIWEDRGYIVESLHIFSFFESLHCYCNTIDRSDAESLYNIKFKKIKIKISDDTTIFSWLC